MTATDDRVWSEFDPAHVDICPMCAWRAKELEAAAGHRCADCLERFDKPYRQPDPDNPTLCPACQRNAVHRASAPKGVPSWGKGA